MESCYCIYGGTALPLSEIGNCTNSKVQYGCCDCHYFRRVVLDELTLEQKSHLDVLCDGYEREDEEAGETVFTILWCVDESELECSGFEEENNIICIAGILKNYGDVKKTYTSFPDEIPESCPAAAAALHLFEKYLEENGFQKKKDAK